MLSANPRAAARRANQRQGGGGRPNTKRTNGRGQSLDRGLGGRNRRRGEREREAGEGTSAPIPASPPAALALLSMWSDATHSWPPKAIAMPTRSSPTVSRAPSPRRRVKGSGEGTTREGTTQAGRGRRRRSVSRPRSSLPRGHVRWFPDGCVLFHLGRSIAWKRRNALRRPKENTGFVPVVISGDAHLGVGRGGCDRLDCVA